MNTTPWNSSQLPSQVGRTFLVTGATGGIGYFIAEQLTATGAEVVLAGRSEAKIDLATRAVLNRVPDAQLRHVRVDLSDLKSVHRAGEELNRLPKLDGVVLNAGVLAQDSRSETVDGHELVYGTNHLGHFALIADIYPALMRVDGSRIITVGSVAARWTRLDLEDLESTRTPYRGFDVYKKSKLAQVIFAIELDRRLRKAASPVSSLIAHPGGALDGLTPSRPPLFHRSLTGLIRAAPRAGLVQGKDRAAWAPVQSLIDPHARGGEIRGPRFLRSKGLPKVEHPTAVMTDGVTAAHLWERSEQAVGHPGFLRGITDRPVSNPNRPETSSSPNGT